MSESLSFKWQVSSILESMSKTAMEEICKVVDGDFAYVRQELSRVLDENVILQEKILNLQSEIESMHVTKTSVKYRSVYVQTEDGESLSINSIYGKDWCSSLWQRQEDKPPVDVGVCPVSSVKHEEGNSDLPTKGNFDLDIPSSIEGETPQTGEFPLSPCESFTYPLEEDECSEMYETRSITSDSLFPSEAQEDDRSENICADATNITESQVKQFKKRTEKESMRPAFSCSVCGKLFKYQGTLARHKRKHHREGSHPCQVCKSVFFTKNQLKTHNCWPFSRRKHSTRWNILKQKYRCEVCGRSTSSRSSLRSHYVVHSRERPFKCNHCGRAFARRGTLLSHERIHERPYICVICEKGFNNQAIFEKHCIRHALKDTETQKHIFGDVSRYVQVEPQ